MFIKGFLKKASDGTIKTKVILVKDWGETIKVKNKYKDDKIGNFMGKIGFGIGIAVWTQIFMKSYGLNTFTLMLAIFWTVVIFWVLVFLRGLFDSFHVLKRKNYAPDIFDVLYFYERYIFNIKKVRFRYLLSKTPN